ncbi:MAG: cobalamin-dependent protein, partial [Ilumatobacteraceae bacterium]
MASVLLAHSYFIELDPKQHAKMRPYPPLNTLHAATVLRNDGYDVAVFDAMLAPDESAFAASLAQHRPDVVVFYEDNFNFLSKMCLTRMREAALAMIGMARAAGCRVAACGADVTDQASLYLAAGVEACLLGEGEHTMREVVARWLGPQPYQPLVDIAGLAVSHAGQPISTG